jgi:hypothetical protein
MASTIETYTGQIQESDRTRLRPPRRTVAKEHYYPATRSYAMADTEVAYVELSPEERRAEDVVVVARAADMLDDAGLIAAASALRASVDDPSRTLTLAIYDAAVQLRSVLTAPGDVQRTVPLRTALSLVLQDRGIRGVV